MKTTKRNSLLSCAVTLGLFIGCGSMVSAPASAQKATESPDGLNRCALLTDDEVNTAIGPHKPGKTDFMGEYALQSCVWTASMPPKSKAPQGWFDSIEVTVFFKDKTAWARHQAKGDPVQGVVAGAVYDSSYGQVWFNCGGDRFCVVKARTASGANRQQLAVQLAKTVSSRLR